jgi:ribosomal protein S18 acetylase RimI-like enzyme
MENNWIVKVAEKSDLERWQELLSVVKNDFYDLDLANDENHINFLMKNIDRKTAVYIEEYGKIIGGVVYSTSSNHISWLGVDPQYRRKGIGTLLVKFALEKLNEKNEIKVRTFIEEHWQSKISHPFYKSLGFEPNEVIYENMENNAGHPMIEFIWKMES